MTDNAHSPFGSFFARDRTWQPVARHEQYRTSVTRSPDRAPLSMPQTLSETTGPVFGHDLIDALDNDLLHNFAADGQSAIGPRIIVHGRMLDETGRAVPDALIEIWQADSVGRYPGNDPRGPADPEFSGFGRAAGSYETGEWRIETIKPGPVPFPDGRMQAPHITVWVVARGINLGLHTRMYFPDEENDADPFLSRIEHQRRVPTLIAEKTADASYRFDIRLQGDGETIFFDI